MAAVVAFLPLAGCTSAPQLREAIERSDISEVRNELGTVTDINESIYVGRTALMLAARRASPEIVKLLIERGANVNARTTFLTLQYSVLMLAAEESRADNIAVLLAHGADVNANDHIGRTPLMHLAQGAQCDERRTLESAKLLIQKSANVEAMDNSGNAAWALALFTDLPSSSGVEFLFPRDTRGDIPRHRSCKKALARLLLRNSPIDSDRAPMLIRMGGVRFGGSYHGGVADPLPVGATSVTREFSAGGYRGTPVSMSVIAARGIFMSWITTSTLTQSTGPAAS